MSKEQMDQRLMKVIKKYEPGANDKLIGKVEKNSIYEEIEVSDMSFKMLRDKLVLIGKILEEDEKKQTYIACIYAGTGNFNPCFFVLTLKGDILYVDAFAKEGLINQHTADKALKKLKKKL